MKISLAQLALAGMPILGLPEVPEYVCQAMSSSDAPKTLHSSAKIYDDSQAKQLVNQWVFWWDTGNPSSEWFCDKITEVEGDEVCFDCSNSRELRFTLLYVIPKL